MEWLKGKKSQKLYTVPVLVSFLTAVTKGEP